MEIVYIGIEKRRCNRMHEIGIDISVVGNYEQFQKLTEKIRCRVIPITRDRRVWLDEKLLTMIRVVSL